MSESKSTDTTTVKKPTTQVRGRKMPGQGRSLTVQQIVDIAEDTLRGTVNGLNNTGKAIKLTVELMLEVAEFFQSIKIEKDSSTRGLMAKGLKAELEQRLKDAADNK